MPPNFQDEGIEAAKEVRRSYPGTGIVVLSQFDEPDYAISLLREGASGYAYLLKERVADGDRLARVDGAVAGAAAFARDRRPRGRDDGHGHLDGVVDDEGEVLVEGLGVAGHAVGVDVGGGHRDGDVAGDAGREEDALHVVLAVGRPS